LTTADCWNSVSLGYHFCLLTVKMNPAAFGSVFVLVLIYSSICTACLQRVYHYWCDS